MDHVRYEHIKAQEKIAVKARLQDTHRIPLKALIPLGISNDRLPTCANLAMDTTAKPQDWSTIRSCMLLESQTCSFRDRGSITASNGRYNHFLLFSKRRESKVNWQVASGPKMKAFRCCSAVSRSFGERGGGPVDDNPDLSFGDDADVGCLKAVSQFDHGTIIYPRNLHFPRLFLLAWRVRTVAL